jgi:hypothetical protein
MNVLIYNAADLEWPATDQAGTTPHRHHQPRRNRNNLMTKPKHKNKQNKNYEK